MGDFFVLLGTLRWQDALDIALVFFVVYQLLLLLRGTRAMFILIGLAVIFLVMLVSQRLEMWTISWLISSFASSIIIILIVLFQADIRRVLARIGERNVFGRWLTNRQSLRSSVAMIEEIVRASVAMASNMTGALIVIERKMELTDIIENGARIDSLVNRELLLTVFYLGTPLHDGAVVISDERIVAARCVLPLSANPSLARHLGTRHRAALGLSEEYDAICVVVSEERGLISIAVEGQLHSDLDAVALRRTLKELLGLVEEHNKKKTWPWRKRHAD